ncbi:MAG: acyl-CoA dehydrogenase [Deltaproteobacteria bacterium]|nr:acyl-CoA dehydrogenase [Deltaproteobacteria bacterium]
MDFDFNKLERDLLSKIEEIIKDESLPNPDISRHAKPNEIALVLRAWLERLGNSGFLAEPAGPGRLAAQLELAHRSPWLALASDIGSHVLCDLISRHGSDEQKKAFLEPILKGKKIAAVAASETLSGSVQKTMNTIAVKNSGGFLLTGAKSTVSLGPMADIIGVLGQIKEGMALFLVDRGQPGVEAGDPLETLGYRELCTCPIALHDVIIEPERIIGPFDSSKVDLLQELRTAWDQVMGAVACGTMRLCLDQARAAADVKRTHGKPPAGYQSVRFSLAEMLTLSQTAEILVLRAAWAAASGDPQAASLGLCAKVFATKNACEVADKALQIMASAGYTKPNPVERALRDARLGTIMGNTSEVAQMAIADNVLERF